MCWNDVLYKKTLFRVKLLTIFAKYFLLDIWQGFKYAFVFQQSGWFPLYRKQLAVWTQELIFSKIWKSMKLLQIFQITVFSLH